jgi:isopentenyl-diphosphate delta-isomerase
MSSDMQAERARANELRALREESVVLVDADDRVIGTMSKLRAHQEGHLHRAVSVLVRDSAGALLLQRRAAEKYHSPGLWSNSCCGHPRPGESPHAAASRRLREELGLDCQLTHAFTFSYEAALGDGMREHEVDHVFVGQTDDAPVPDPVEVGEWRRLQPELLHREMEANPEEFTVWFRVLMDRIRRSDPFAMA